MKEGKTLYPHLAYSHLNTRIRTQSPLHKKTCLLQQSATEKVQFASGPSEQQTISITFSKNRKQGVNCAGVSGVPVSPGTAAQATPSDQCSWPGLSPGLHPHSALPGLVSKTEHELQRDFSQRPPALFALFLAGSRQRSSHEMHK